MSNKSSFKPDDEFKCLPDYYIETKKSISEFILQSIFLLLILNLEKNYHLNSNKSALSHKIRDIFIHKQFDSSVTKNKITFKKIMTQIEFYAYLKSVFINLVGTNDASNQSKVFVNFQNYLIGVPRIHIKQVKVAECQSFFNISRVRSEKANIECFTDWSPTNERHTNRTYNKSYVNEINDDKIKEKIYQGFKYRNKDSFKGWCVVVGELNRYDCGGYHIELFRSASDNIKLVEHLEKLDWIDLSTRMIAIQFNLYNPSIKYLSVIKFIIEFKNSGGAVVSDRINVLF